MLSISITGLLYNSLFPNSMIRINSRGNCEYVDQSQQRKDNYSNIKSDHHFVSRVHEYQLCKHKGWSRCPICTTNLLSVVGGVISGNDVRFKGFPGIARQALQGKVSLLFKLVLRWKSMWGKSKFRLWQQNSHCTNVYKMYVCISRFIVLSQNLPLCNTLHKTLSVF